MFGNWLSLVDKDSELDDKPLALFVRKGPGVVYFRRINR
jgi:hypothetical protein